MQSGMTKRPKDCIICGNRTGTGEHVFPSALGGRRENKGIYCPDHNHWLGSHVSVLQQQLGLINAFLEVEPDRGSAKPFVVEARDGQRYAVAKGEIRPAPDLDEILDSYAVGQVQQLKLDPTLLPKLKARAEERGLKLEILEQSQPSTAYRLEHHPMRLSLGGDDGMRAVAYLALTFVAHYWPDVARSPTLSQFKHMIRSGNVYAGADLLGAELPASDFVHWAPARRAPTEVIHPTGIGHTLIICINSGQLLAYVSLLDLQCFVVLLGHDDTKHKDCTVVVHVDPFEKHFGKDWTTHEFDRALIDRAIDASYLGEAVLENNQIQAHLSAVIRRVVARRDMLEARRAAQEFEVAKSLPECRRRAAIRLFVERHGQRLVNQMVMFAQDGNDSNPAGALIKMAANIATQADPSSADGLNDFARRVLSNAVTRIADQLMEVPSEFRLDEERYFALFEGELAQAIVALALMEESIVPH